MSLTFKDRVVEFPNRIKLTPVAGQENVYDVSRQEGSITQEGTPLNALNLNRLVSLEEAYTDPTVNLYRLNLNRLNLERYIYSDAYNQGAQNLPILIMDNRGDYAMGIGLQNEVDTIHLGAVTRSSIKNGAPAWNNSKISKWKFHGDIFATNRIKVDSSGIEINKDGIFKNSVPYIRSMLEFIDYGFIYASGQDFPIFDPAKHSAVYIFGEAEGWSDLALFQTYHKRGIFR